MMIVKPRIEILPRNLIIPFALELLLREYFCGNDEAAHPNGSKNLAMIANMVFLVLSSDYGTVMRN